MHNEEIIEEYRGEYESSLTNEICAALAKAQGEMSSVDTDSVNSHFKNAYASLNNILRAIRPVLAAHGLSITQQLISDKEGNFAYMHTKLRHSSGQWIGCRLKIVNQKNDYHGLGSAITYLRRYSLCALLGISVGKDEDDDANEAVSYQQQQYNEHHPRATLSPSTIVITEEELDDLLEESMGYPELVETIYKKLNITTLAQMKRSFFKDAIKFLRESKNKLRK